MDDPIATAIVAAARGCIGVRFRLQGRDRAHGLDCVGLCAVALAAGGYAGPVPSGYALRSRAGAAAMMQAESAGLSKIAPGDARPGDVVLYDAGPGQIHLAILVSGGIIHADAMLRRVVERPGVPPWPVVAAWRLSRH